MHTLSLDLPYDIDVGDFLEEATARLLELESRCNAGAHTFSITIHEQSHGGDNENCYSAWRDTSVRVEGDDVWATIQNAVDELMSDDSIFATVKLNIHHDAEQLMLLKAAWPSGMGTLSLSVTGDPEA